MRTLLTPALLMILCVPTLAQQAPAPVTEGADALGSRLYATTRAYGKFILHVGAEKQEILCEGIPGISGVETFAAAESTADGRPTVQLRRLITHFHQDIPGLPLIIINQDLTRESTGTLTGNKPGNVTALFPGTATFDQYIYIKIGDVVVTNREPLRVVAEDVTSWPPVGAYFRLEKATDFYPVGELHDKDAGPIATLDACAIEVVSTLALPAPGSSTTAQAEQAATADAAP